MFSRIRIAFEAEVHPVFHVNKCCRHIVLTMLSLAALAWTPAYGQSSMDGFTEPFRRAELATVEPGVVANILVQEGDRVTADQLVAHLENTSLKAAAEVARAKAQSLGRLDAAEAERQLRKRRLERLKELRVDGHANQEEVNRAETDLAVAQANHRIAAEQQQIDVLESKQADAMLERRNVRSTINGHVVLVHHQPGEFVTSAAPAVVTVVQIDKLRVTFALPTADARQLAAGDKVRVHFPETEVTAAALIETVSLVTDPESGTVRVRVVIDNADERYACGVKCMLVPPGENFEARN